MARGNQSLAMQARLAAFKDIAEECRLQRHGRNYVLCERDICELLGIPAPDFRMFNGGYDKNKDHGRD